MAVSYCIERGCPNPRVYRSRCAAHSKQRERDTHSRENKRVYNSKKWQMTRRRYLFENPICMRCHWKLAEHVHHKKGLSEGGDAYAFDNLMSLCAPCHAKVERDREGRNF